MVTIINGVNTLTASLAGHTVAEVRGLLAQALNIDPSATAMVAAQAVETNYELADGDELEFVKSAGTKG